MAGEEIPVAKVTPRGFLGDRVYALVEKESNRAATVRTWAAALLSYRSQFLTEPELDAPSPNVHITTPEGCVLTTTDPDFDAQLSASFGRHLTVMTTAPSGLLVEFPAGSLGGTLSNTTELPLAGAAPPGTFFDYACVHLIATSTIDHLQAAYPQGRFDVRRFRPNIVIQSQGEPYIENSWGGRMLAIGDEAVLRVTIPCPRCVNTTLPQSDLPHDAGILRTIAKHNRRDLGDFGSLPCAGVYADVVKPGTIRRGDSVRYAN
jgi:MOSC domain-containing protein